MRRSRWNRTLSAIFAVWLAFASGDAGFAHHHCPMHDGPVPAAASAGGVHGGAHASHGEHGAPQPGGHHLCTCIGTCSASSGAVALAEPAALPTALVSFVRGAPPAGGERSAPAPRAPFTLPFANGPPLPIA